MKIGYVRTSTAEQNTARQEVLMAELGVDQVFIDRMSGKSLDRPELTQMMDYVRRGDRVVENWTSYGTINATSYAGRD